LVLRQVYLKKFAVAGLPVRAVCNDEEAVAAIRAHPAAELILDFQIPMMDGFQVLKQFPKESRTFSVIALKSFSDTHHGARGSSWRRRIPGQAREDDKAAPRESAGSARLIFGRSLTRGGS